MTRNRAVRLTEFEKKVIKALLAQGKRNQDIQALVNIGRDATINSGRITEIKQNKIQEAATDKQVKDFVTKRKTIDPITGLNLYDDGRLIQAREAMILAVQIFNSPAMNFKSHVFTVLANIAWTYLLHEYYERKNVAIADKNNQTLSLKKMINLPKNPLTAGVRNNLTSIIELRNAVEHQTLGVFDTKWFALFQACCLNFDKGIQDFFGQRLSLKKELAFALQFAKMDISQISNLGKDEIPANIQAIDARITKNLTEKQMQDMEYRFSVLYTLDSASKNQAHFELFNPTSAQGKSIRNVLVKQKLADENYPYHPQDVIRKVQSRTERTFSMTNHTQAWKYFHVRPNMKAKQLDNTVKKYCIYHSAHNDYTYSNKWIDKLIDEVSDKDRFNKIKSFKINK